MPLGMDPKAIKKALAASRTHNTSLFLQTRREPVSTSYHVKEQIKDCDNLIKLQDALIIALETAIWVHDDQSERPYDEGIGGEMWAEIKKILED